MGFDKDSVVVVTGGASGIGLSCVNAILEKGSRVVIADLNEEAGNKIVSGNERTRFFKTNVTDENNVKELIQYTVKEFGKVTAAVNCAGIATAGIIVLLNIVRSTCYNKGCSRHKGRHQNFSN